MRPAFEPTREQPLPVAPYVRRVRGWLGVLLGSLSLLAADGARRVAAQAFPDSAFDARTAAELRRLLDESRAAGLPEGPLINRARQGAARRVSGDRVVALVRAHADSMRAARTALGARASADELDAGASALHAGASRAVLRRMRAVRTEGTATTAMIVLTDLLWRGVPLRDASDAIASLAERSPDRALLALQGAVAREGTPRTTERLQAMVERFAKSVPETGGPRRSPARPDSIPRGPAGASMSVASLSAPASSAPSAILAEGRYDALMGGGWGLAPAAAMRLDDAGNRFSGGLTVSHHLASWQRSSGAVWLRGEVRSPIAASRETLRLNSGLEASAESGRRPPEVAIEGGATLLRDVGRRWRATGNLGIGHARFSRIETIFVERQVGPVTDTLTPRPDTLRPQTVRESQNIWRARISTTVRSGLSLRRANVMLSGQVVQRIGELGDAGADSLSSSPRTLVSLGAEVGVAPWAALVTEWASHDPSRIAGTLALSDARWRLGVRVTESPRRRGSTVPASRGAANREFEGPMLSLLPLASSDSASVGRGVRLRVLARTSRLVEVEGDLTGWNPVSLTRGADGVFTGEFVVTSPVVRLRLRLDGGAWTTPPNVPTQRDDFGDAVAVIVVPAAERVAER